MIDRRSLHVEVAGRLATIYVVGPLGREAHEALLNASELLPESVQVLCVSVSDLDHLGTFSSAALPELRRHWHATRRGAFRVAFDRGFIESAAEGSVLLAG